MELTGKIVDVTGRKVTTKFGEKDVYDVVFSDGNTYGTFKEPLAAEASRAKGIDGVTIKVEQNGDFFNFGGVTSLNGNSETSETITPTTIPSGPSVKDKDIHKQLGFKVAAMFLNGSGVDEQELFSLAQRIADSLDGVNSELPEWQAS